MQDNATAYLTPAFSATTFSISLMFAPTVDILFVSYASITYFISMHGRWCQKYFIFKWLKTILIRKHFCFLFSLNCYRLPLYIMIYISPHASSNPLPPDDKWSRSDQPVRECLHDLNMLLPLRHPTD